MGNDASRSSRRVSPQVLRHILAARPAILAFLVSLLRDIRLAEEVFKDLCVAASQGKLEGVTDDQLAPILRAARDRALAHMHACASNGVRVPPAELVDQIEQAIVEMTQPRPPWEDRRMALQKALRALPSTLHQVFALRYGHRMAASDIAKRLGLSPESLRQRLQQARMALGGDVPPPETEGHAP